MKQNNTKYIQVNQLNNNQTKKNKNNQPKKQANLSFPTNGIWEIFLVYFHSQRDLQINNLLACTEEFWNNW